MKAIADFNLANDFLNCRAIITKGRICGGKKLLRLMLNTVARGKPPKGACSLLTQKCKSSKIDKWTMRDKILHKIRLLIAKEMHAVSCHFRINIRIFFRHCEPRRSYREPLNFLYRYEPSYLLRHCEPLQTARQSIFYDKKSVMQTINRFFYRHVWIYFPRLFRFARNDGKILSFPQKRESKSTFHILCNDTKKIVSCLPHDKFWAKGYHSRGNEENADLRRQKAPFFHFVFGGNAKTQILQKNRKEYTR